MACNSTYLIDRKTHISPKLKELEGILDEDEFTVNPQCRVFLSTDAGGTGLNLQAADCVVNFELPWNPARVRQRVGRVNRIGQVSRCINVVNLITKNSIEEKILAGLQLKTDLFAGVFDGGADTVEFTREKRTELLNQLRGMLAEEPLPPLASAVPSEEIAEDTPHYLNPEALKSADDRTVDVTVEENAVAAPPEALETASATSPPAFVDPQRMEEVLNSGMAFIGGLLEMATGRKMEPSATDGRMLHVDRQSGEVTLKFKLPGFESNAPT